MESADTTLVVGVMSAKKQKQSSAKSINQAKLGLIKKLTDKG